MYDALEAPHNAHVCKTEVKLPHLGPGGIANNVHVAGCLPLQFSAPEGVGHTYVCQRANLSESNSTIGVDEFRANLAIDIGFKVSAHSVNWRVAHLFRCTFRVATKPTHVRGGILLLDKEILDKVADGASECRMPQIHVGKATADPELADELVVFGSKWIRFHVKANNTVRSAMKTLGEVSEEVNVADVVGAIHGGLETF